MLIIVSPAKKLDFETPAPTERFTNLVELKKSEKLIEGLRKCKPQEISHMMKLSDALTELNIKRYRNFQTPFNLKNSKQAIYAFKGDTYVGLNAQTMKTKDIDYAQKHLRILSGLYGVVAPLDLIQPYRLEMGTKFSCGESKNLYEYWKDIITKKINILLRKEKYLINLASQEYFSAIDTKKLNADIVTPVFKEKKDKEFKMIGIYAKKARGMMARYIIDHQIENYKKIEGFDVDGYRYNKKLSTDLAPVFTRG